jgi:hypothetical protein
MNKGSVLRFGGLAAVAVGILYLLVGATHFMMPRVQLRGASGVSAEFFASLAQGSAVFQLHYWIVVVLALLTLAAIVAFGELLRGRWSGPVLWALALGGFGAALMALDFAQFGVWAPRLAGKFVAADDAARPLLAAFGVPHSDPCFFAYGLMGGFALIGNLAVLKHRLLPRGLALIGACGGVLYLLLFAGSLAQLPLVVDVAVGLGGLLVAPVWHVGTGLALIRTGSQ